jgi:hypothetical protein
LKLAKGKIKDLVFQKCITSLCNEVIHVGCIEVGSNDIHELICNLCTAIGTNIKKEVSFCFTEDHQLHNISNSDAQIEQNTTFNDDKSHNMQLVDEKLIIIDDNSHIQLHVDEQMLTTDDNSHIQLHVDEQMLTTDDKSHMQLVDEQLIIIGDNFHMQLDDEQILTADDNSHMQLVDEQMIITDDDKSKMLSSCDDNPLR